MAYKNRYFKNFPARNNGYSFAEIGAQVEYTDSTTFTLFVTESVAGEIGVFNAATGGVMAGLAPASTTLPIFFAINGGLDKDGKITIRKSDPFTVANSVIVKSLYVAPVKGVTVLAITGAPAPVAGDVLGIKVLDLTVAGNPLSSFDFNVKVKTGETLDQAMARLVLQINDTAGIYLGQRDPVVTAAYTAGTDTLTITNVDYGSVVKVLPQGALATYTITTTITKTVLGHGFPEEVKLWEETRNIGNGVTTNYPSVQGTNALSFGIPDSFVVDTGQYTHYTIRRIKDDTAKIHLKVQHWDDVMEVIVPSNGTANPDAELAMILGV